MKQQNEFNKTDTDIIPTEDIIADEIEDSGLVATIRLDVNPSEIKSGISSEIGKRAYQQDAARVDNEYMYVENNLFLATMCDGMGGMNGGEKASKLCVDTMFEAFYCVDVKGRVPSFFKFMADNLDKMIHNLKDDNGNPLKSGTTLTSVIIEKNNLYWVSVGDSRIYLKRGNEMISITVDHNYKLLLDEQVKKGIITKEQADSNPEKEALISFMGIGGINYIDINPNPLKLLNDDCILLCSDGLYRTLSTEEMIAIIDSCDDMQKAAEMLTSAAINKGKRNQDNTTAVLLKYIENKANTAEM
jgi:protein phosphatase